MPLESRTRFAHPPALRWALVLAASLCIHFLALRQIGTLHAFQPEALVSVAPLEMELVQQQVPPPKPAAPAKLSPQPSKPKPLRKPQSAPPKETASNNPVPHMPADAMTALETDAPALAEKIDPQETPAPAAENDADLAQLMGEQLAPPEPDFEPPPAFALPPSAQLRYDVVAWKDEQPWYGKGEFIWRNDDSRYQLLGEASASIFFVKVPLLNFSSEGAIHTDRLQPALYIEKPRKKPELRTEFRGGQEIVFAATGVSLAMSGATQDRASVVWQLAGLARGASEELRSDTMFQIPVAGTRSAKTWFVRVLGQNEITTPAGKISTWHLAQVRERGSSEERIDIWLAPALEWYPVKIRHSSDNGDYVELVLTEIREVAPTAHTIPNQMETE